MPAKQRRHADAGLQHPVHIALALAIQSRVVRDQPHALARQRREFLLHQDVQPRQNLSIARHHAATAGPQ